MSREAERVAMVSQQLIPRRISDSRVLEAFLRVPRHEFLHQESLREAYADYPLPIGEGQTISQPYMVALMTECLNLKGDGSVLEIGTGSGYQTAILAELAKNVYSVERFQSLSRNAKQNLDKLGYTNVYLKTGDGTLGWPEHAPYDRILVTAGAPDVPNSLIQQLKENGRLVIPVGGAFSQVLTVVENKKEGIVKTDVCGCIFVPLVGQEGWRKESDA
jgi:protein-L-isoaspartate(D-aspartate) O-methyltransferase